MPSLFSCLWEIKYLIYVNCSTLTWLFQYHINIALKKIFTISKPLIYVDDYHNYTFHNSHRKWFASTNSIYLHVRRGPWFNKFELVLKWALHRDDNSEKYGKMEELVLKPLFFEQKTTNWEYVELLKRIESTFVDFLVNIISLQILGYTVKLQHSGR